MRRSFSVFLLVLLLVFAAPQTGRAAGPKLLGTFGDWSAYTLQEEGGQVCYILSTPKKALGSYKKRGEIFALVTHRPAEKEFNVFSVMAGYDYRSDSSVTLTIDGQKFVLFTHNDSAWAPDSGTDKRLAEALRKGTTMSIKGQSAKGTETTDTYGLKGTGAAFEAIDKACPKK
jgi:hypothetical protein